MTRTRKVITRSIAACVGLCAGILGSEMTFGQLRADPVQKSPAVLYSIELRNGQGDLLASPLVVGEEGQSVHLNLLQQPVPMSLDLDPRPSEAGLCLGYKLSMDDGLAHRGRVEIPYGADGGLVLLQGGGHLWLRAARAHTAAFRQLLSLRTNRPAA
ncbi:MAG TPA: hypothetical protein VGH20_02700 [Myxococcales bacterium]|jgi:hypothetical protein